MSMMENPESPWCKKGLKAVAIGPVVAVMLMTFPFTAWICHYLSILLHESGHTMFFWLFGYPAIPVFDLSHGGGFAQGMARSPAVFWMLHDCLLPIVWLSTKRKLYAALLIPTALLWLAAMHTDLHEAVILYMGHGSELLLAGVFLYRATTGVALKHESERPVYSALGFYLIFENIVFSIKLIRDQGYRHTYTNDPRGAINDFHDLAFTHLGNVDVGVVPGFHIAMCLATVLIAAFAIRYVKVYC